MIGFVAVVFYDMRDLKVIVDNEHRSKYKWFIQEFEELEENSNKIGEDLRPWNGTIEFSISDLKYSFALKNKNHYTSLQVERNYSEHIDAHLLSFNSIIFRC